VIFELLSYSLNVVAQSFFRIDRSTTILPLGNTFADPLDKFTIFSPDNF